MKNLKYFVIALTAIAFTACSNGALKLESKKINGPLGKFYEVVEKDYQINGNEVSIEIKRIAEGGPVDASWDSRPTFTAELFDKSGNLISSKSTDVVWTEDQLETVFALGVGETSSITFNFNDKTRGAVKIKISSKWDEKEDSEETTATYGSGDAGEAEEVSAPTNADIDAMLNQLEGMLNRLAKMDDLSDEYDDLEDQIMDFMDRIDDLDMSAAQEKRYDKLDDRFDKM